jgi:hypothetical protein
MCAPSLPAACREEGPSVFTYVRLQLFRSPLLLVRVELLSGLRRYSLSLEWTILLLLLLLPCLLPAPPPPSSLSSCCSLFLLRLLLQPPQQFLLHLLLLPHLLLLVLLFSCCFLAFGRFSLVPSEGPLISDQLRRGLLIFLRYFSTYSYILLAHHHPSRPPLTD